MSNAAKSFDILATSLTVHNIIILTVSNKIIFIREFKFLSKPFFPCRIFGIVDRTTLSVERLDGVKFNFRADRTSQRGFALVRLWTAAKLLSRRVASMWITRRVALRRGEERPRQRRHASTVAPATAGDKRFIVLSFYAPDSLECELHYFTIVARTSRRYDVQIAPLRRSAQAIRDNSYVANRRPNRRCAFRELGINRLFQTAHSYASTGISTRWFRIEYVMLYLPTKNEIVNHTDSTEIILLYFF